MTEPIRFTLDGRTVEAQPGESLWQVAQRLGSSLPHLCHRPARDYRPDGNCRACLVEIDGERSLVASCIRAPTPGAVVRTDSPRARRARTLVLELLASDQPPTRRDPQAALWHWVDAAGADPARFPRSPDAAPPPPDTSHPAMAVHLDACIQCGLCQRACTEIQGNDVIALAGRGEATRVVFDQADPMGTSSCVGCGECVQACPTGALMPSSLVGADGVRAVTAERAIDTLCPYCGVGCQMRVQVAGDRIIAVEGRDGPANHARLCVKGRFGYHYAHHPHRLTQPLIRRDDAPKSAELRLDPANPWTHFRPASWEEALARAGAGFRAIRASKGGAALAGLGSAKGSNEEAYLFQKLIRLGFGTNTVDHCTRLCHASSVAALLEGIGSGAVTAPFEAALDADLIIVIGANPSVNHPVAASFIKNSAQRGADLIVIDPRGQALARHARTMVQHRPGSDVALLGAMLHTIVAEGLGDTDYLDRMADGFADLAIRLGTFQPDAMAAICGIDAATIRDLARRYARARRALIFWGMGVSQHVHGTDTVRCLIALAVLTGHIGKPGSGLHPLRGQNNVQGASDAGLIPMMLPDYVPVGDAARRAVVETEWGQPLSPERGLTVVEITDAIHAGRIEGLYIMGENPAMSDPDLTHTRQALAKLKHLVVQDIFLTETAWHADVVLPASSFFEKSGSFTSTDRRVQLALPVLPPPGAARQDLDIVQAMAREMGLTWSYDGPAEVFAEMTRVMPSLAHITWKRLEEEGSVMYPAGEPGNPSQPILFGDRFPTPSGRARLVPVGLVPPDEQPDADFPLILTTGRVLEHWHTGAMTRRATLLDALEPVPFIALSPDLMAARGIAPGAEVRLTTRRGSIAAVARPDPALPPDLVFLPFCYTEAAANLLTNPALDPFGKIPEFKFCAARLEQSIPTR